MEIKGKDITVQGRFVRIARLNGDKYKFLDNAEDILEGLRTSGTRVDLFTFMQRLPETKPQYSYPMEWDNFAALRMLTFDAWWTQQIDNKTRNMVRKAERKGVHVREVPFDHALADGIWQVYNECPVRQGRPFRHYGKDIETVRREEATFLDSSFFIGAFLGEALIGFIKLTIDETHTQAGMMNIVSMVQHRDKAPTNALIAQAVRSCAERRIPYLVYSNFSYAKKQRDGITEFKESNGFQRVDLPRYYVALTHLGQVAFRVGLHHRLVDRLPEAVLERVRGLRSSWHSGKLPAAGRS